MQPLPAAPTPSLSWDRRPGGGRPALSPYAPDAPARTTRYGPYEQSGGYLTTCPRPQWREMLIPAPVAPVQELILDEPDRGKVAGILAAYPPGELRVMAAQFSEMAELVNDYADRRGVRHVRGAD